MEETVGTAVCTSMVHLIKMLTSTPTRTPSSICPYQVDKAQKDISTTLDKLMKQQQQMQVTQTDIDHQDIDPDEKSSTGQRLKEKIG